MRPLCLRGGRVLVEGDLVETDLRIEDGRIAAVGEGAPDGALVLDMAGRMVLPAIVDVHGDAFERQVMPRDGVFVPTEVAVIDTDRQLAANGIATAYHALTLSWEPGLRSVARGEMFLDALAALEPRLSVENRVQLRWETFAFEALPLMARALAGTHLPSIAFNDHTSMSVRSAEIALQDRPRVLAPDQVVDLADPAVQGRYGLNAKRAGIATEAYARLLLSVWDRRDEVDRVTAEVAAMGRAAGAPMLSHDDSTPEMRAHFATLGARIAEFPMTAATARAARAAGGHVVLGAPNVMRGGSHLGLVSAADMVEEGACDILASDYYYPAMLGAVARLHAERRAPFARLWACVSANPARASGLTDRGEIAAGRRADLAVLDWPEGGRPMVVATLSAGRIAHLAAEVFG